MISFIASKLVKMAAPPLLRAFNLSKQPFSLPHNNQDAIFSHRSSGMLARSPFFPSLSFLPKSSPSITSDEWRDHHTSLLDGVHNHKVHNPKTLFPEAIKKPSQTQPKTAQPVSADSFSFNREYSPNSSTVTAVVANIPTKVHASSLMQMWSEQEVATPPPAEAEEPSDRSDACEESKLFAKENMGAEPATSLLHSPSPELSPTPSPTPDTGGKKFHVRGRQELEDFILKLEEVFRRERPRRLQSATQFPNSLSVTLFRKTHEDESEDDINEVPTKENKISMEVQLSNSPVYVLTITIDHFDIENNRLVGLISTRRIEYSPQAFHSLQAFYTSSSQYEDQLDCQKPLDSHMLQALLDEISSDVTEMSNEEQIVVSGDGNWFLQPINSWRGWWRK